MAYPARLAARFLLVLWILIPSLAVASAVDGPSTLEHLPLGASAVTTAQGDPVAGGGSLTGIMELVRVGGALAGVVALLVGLRVVVKRWSGSPSSRRPDGIVQVHARYPVARGQQILLIQVADRMIVAHQGGGRLETLSEITDAEEVARLRGRLQGDSGSDLEFAEALSRAREDEDIVDLTRPAEPRRGAPRRGRLPGWRSTS